MARNSRSRPKRRMPGLFKHWRLFAFTALLSLLLGGILAVPIVPSAVGPEVRVGFPRSEERR